MNLLLTCAGRRSYLVEYFNQLPEVDEVHTANSIIDSPAMLVSDHIFHTESIYSENYVDSIVSYCKKHDIKMVVSLLDLELPILAKRKQSFRANKIFLAISDYSVCCLCNDKYLTQKFLLDNNFSTVNVYLQPSDVLKAVANAESNFPFFIKPRWGMGSIGIYQAYCEDELFVFYKRAKKEIKNSYLNTNSRALNGNDVIIQEKLIGDEYGLDVLNDFDGNYLRTFVKKKGEMRAGETDSATTVENDTLEDLGKRVSKKLKHLGNLDIDVFFNGEDAYILEMNPRFGGGYPFTHVAGGNIVKAYIDLFQEKKVTFNFYPNVKSAKTITLKTLT